MTKLDEKIKLIITHWCTNPYPTTEVHVNVAVGMIMDEIESLKAITELAVNGLRLYADKKNWNLGVSISMGSAFPLHEAIKSDKGKIAASTLSEIEKLTK